MRPLSNKTRSAFTLAEVLITLAVIGVIAAMVIPAMQVNIQTNKWKTAYKAAYADISNAMSQAVSKYELENLTVDKFDATINNANFAVLQSYFNVTKECPLGSGTVAQCWDMNGEMGYHDIRPDSTAWGFIDAKGRAWVRPCNGCSPYILVDTNGFEKPNMYGRDRFGFNIAAIDGEPLGDAVKIRPWEDMIAPEPNWCDLGKCYNKIWLFE